MCGFRVAVGEAAMGATGVVGERLMHDLYRVTLDEEASEAGAVTVASRDLDVVLREVVDAADRRATAIGGRAGRGYWGSCLNRAYRRPDRPTWPASSATCTATSTRRGPMTPYSP